jgi:hypothetical protein
MAEIQLPGLHREQVHRYRVGREGVHRQHVEVLGRLPLQRQPCVAQGDLQFRPAFRQEILARKTEWESAIRDLRPIWAMWHSGKRFKGIRSIRAFREFQDKHSLLLKDLPKLREDVSGCWSKKASTTPRLCENG